MTLGLKSFPSRAALLAMWVLGPILGEALPTSLARKMLPLVGVGILPASALLPPGWEAGLGL